MTIARLYPLLLMYAVGILLNGVSSNPAADENPEANVDQLVRESTRKRISSDIHNMDWNLKKVNEKQKNKVNWLGTELAKTITPCKDCHLIFKTLMYQRDQLVQGLAKYLYSMTEQDGNCNPEESQHSGCQYISNLVVNLFKSKDSKPVVHEDKMKNLYFDYVIEPCEAMKLAFDNKSVEYPLHALNILTEEEKSLIDRVYMCLYIVNNQKSILSELSSAIANLNTQKEKCKIKSGVFKELLKSQDKSSDEVLQTLFTMDGCILDRKLKKRKEEIAELIAVSQLDTQPCTRETVKSLKTLLDRYGTESVSINGYLKYYNDSYTSECKKYVNEDLYYKANLIPELNNIKFLGKQVIEGRLLNGENGGRVDYKLLSEKENYKESLVKYLDEYLRNWVLSEHRYSTVKKRYDEYVVESCADWLAATKCYRDFYPAYEEPERMGPSTSECVNYGYLCQHITIDYNLFEAVENLVEKNEGTHKETHL